MSILYLRHPSRSSVDHASGVALDCPFALVADNGQIEREGSASLGHLTSSIRQAKRIVVLLAASDVSLLQVKVPPLSAARLKTALPNLIEDQLISDPAECIVVAAPAHNGDGVRSVAVVQRAWLQSIVKQLVAAGARNIAALPGQLCLPIQPGVVSAEIIEHGEYAELSLRLSALDGMGLPIMAEHIESAPFHVKQMLAAVAPNAAINLRVPAARVAHYQEILGSEVTVVADQWSGRIAAARGLPLDLMAGIDSQVGPQINLKAWRWPLALAASLVLVNLLGMNIEWLRLKREADGLRSAMLQSFKTAYPKETTIIDPLAQMRQKINAGKNGAGQIAPDDFMALAAAVGDVFATLRQQQPALPALAQIEYRERSFFIKFKGDGDLPLSSVKTALAERKLSLTPTPTGGFQIRSEK